MVVFGATGMVGQGVLRESLLAADVERVTVVGRTATGVRHPKLHEIRHTDFTDFTPIAGELAGHDAVFWCLGVSSVGMSEADYTRVTYDYTVAAARVFDPGTTTFVYVSGAGTNEHGRQMWARVKGRTERYVLDRFPRGYALRPGFVQPVHGVRSKTRLYQSHLTMTAPLHPLIRRLAPNATTSTADVGRTMVRLARVGSPDRVLGNRQLVG
ncbi:epimerase [Spirilliplanes yamanashiensis]|uniref:Epimerase n=1 Tax=Spirilliplanes yamanashiensis TaxID=42233 RepID=A0A8J3Y9R7_9ACTN|nr:epimerase [Spirilliplanes yamanashiensis]